MAKENLELYHEIITDAWKYLKHYLQHPPETPDEWSEFVEAGEGIYRKYPNCEQKFGANLIVSVMEEIERISKQKKSTERSVS